MCSDPLDPGGEVRGSSVGCTIGMSDILAIRVAAALDLHRGLLELKICILRQVCFGCGGISFFLFRFVSSNAHGLLQVLGRLASFTSLLVT